MKYLQECRQLADRQQYELLRHNAEHYFHETGDGALLALLAMACAHLGDRDGAERALIELHDNRVVLDLAGHVDLAAAQLLTGRLQLASERLEMVLNEQPDNALALARLAFCRMHNGDLEQARILYQRSVELHPHRLPAWVSLTKLYLLAHQPEHAEQTLQQAMMWLEQLRPQLPDSVVQIQQVQLQNLQLEVWVACDQLATAEAWLERQQGVVQEEDWVACVTTFSQILSGVDRHDTAEEALRNALKVYPKNLSLITAVVELLQLAGRTQQAIVLLRRGIALIRQGEAGGPEMEVVFWARMSTICLHQRHKQARKAAEKACELATGLERSDNLPELRVWQIQAQAKNAQAQVESQAQNYDVSERLFKELLEQNPWFLPSLQGLGQQYMQLGRIDEAVELFNRIREIDPTKGFSALISARQFPEDEQTLERIEKAARLPSLEGSMASGVLFQLASAREKRKDYDRAFTLAADANNGSKKFLQYDPEAHRQRCARIRHAFSRELFEARQGCGYRGEDESLPVFVLGMPRSGTTLVEQILGSHSEIFGAGELGVIPQRIAGLDRWERHVGSGRQYPDCVDDLTPPVTQGIARGILEELKGLASNDKSGARFIVDKLPHNFENIGLIKFLFPKAKIISVRRDPRDIALSNYFTDYQAKHGGMGFAYDMEWIGQQLADHNLLMHHWMKVFPGELLEIQYEDLIENTEFQTRRMLKYIGVEWEPQVLSFNELDRPVKTASVWQVRQPIYKTSTAKWERYKSHLAQLIKGTNAKIEWEPIEMERFPVPGMFTGGVALYKEERLDEAEYEFKKVLHHFPEHGGAHFMVGLIYVRKGHLKDGIAMMEKGLAVCPWNRNWRKDLIQACEMAGDTQRVSELTRVPSSTDTPDLEAANEGERQYSTSVNAATDACHEH
ncbi:sulfotransferase [Aestuariicella sp. G3-2]|uniref:sulfotransferase n=1 Tax=Pseudomaricurvus albidus TaxID=2842452 RepID=UPI001C0B5E5A|nr:sulfotransferase [Aestuariicella albida]MBU3069182.1 sulfotransferase [Aestuariicella albida]